ncbi:MAG TPA: S-layer protein, partial [Planctomycetaceae bacterium]|nr:S-layer protein [Planctomycetaceae bacterium]
ARFQGHVGVFRATVPLGVEVENLPKSNNFVDDLVFGKLQRLGLPASGISNDASFLRRVTIDVAGRLPTLEESEAFLQSEDPEKRSKWIDKLLASTDYADYFANKWSAILRNKRRNDNDKISTYSFYQWIRNSLHENKPYDQFVGEIVTATGSPANNPAVTWFREVKDQAAQVEDTAQLFLGLRIQCARCHHHPFEKWSQQDYYGFAAFFSRIGRKKADMPGMDRVFHNRGKASANNPKTNQAVLPTGLGGEPFEIAEEDDPRQYLADWLGRPDNEFFAKALVNRYWKHFFGRGLVDPEDDMRVTNPASNPELL